MQENTPEQKRISDQQAFEKLVRQRQQILFGERYVGVSISQIRAPDWAAVGIQEFMNKKKNFLIYCGSPGIGKTFLCSAMIEWALKNFQYYQKEKRDRGGKLQQVITKFSQKSKITFLL